MSPFWLAVSITTALVLIGLAVTRYLMLARARQAELMFFREKTLRQNRAWPTNLDEKSLTEAIQRLASEIQDIRRIELATFDAVTAGLVESSKSTKTTLEGGRDRGSSDGKTVVADITHSLGTPLSQIEVALARLESIDPTSSEISESIRDAVDRISAALEISKAFLVSFRGLSDVATAVSQWEPGSLTASLVSAADVYKTVAKKTELEVLIQLPEQLPGYPNTFVLAILLPLLENAVEAAPSGGLISISDSTSDNGTIITVSNLSSELQALDLTDIYEAGVTTKPNHDGLGLSTVRRLLSSRRGATLDHMVNGNKVSFSVTLPSASAR